VDADDLGTRIKRARERARPRMKQEDLAAAVGVDRKTVDNWENARSRPKSSLGALEEVLGKWGFRADGGAGHDEPPAGARAVVLQIKEVLDSRFSDSTKIQMIRDVIERDFGPESESDPQHQAAG
jgi:DNA-binding XRE family transcriptional regulator